MKIEAIHQWKRTVRFREPLRTSYGRLAEREIHLIEVKLSSGVSGYGEIQALPEPSYTAETQESAAFICQKYCFPLFVGQELTHPREAKERLAFIQGNQMAKAGLEMALWDAYAHEMGQPLATILGGDVTKAIAVGATFGIEEDVGRLVEKVQRAVAQGSTRIKLKIQPGQDCKPLRAIRKAFPEIQLMADANGAYQKEAIATLQALDEFNLSMLEQPLGALDLLGHAALQRTLKTPLCLDEAIMSLEDVRLVAQLKAAKIINLKVSRVGGFQAAKEILAFCQEQGLAVWLGGMYETEIGRAGSLAFAAREGFAFPHDLGPSQLYYEQATAEPRIQVNAGQIQLAKTAGLGFQRIIKHDQ